jgi:hypothetical protein
MKTNQVSIQHWPDAPSQGLGWVRWLQQPTMADSVTAASCSTQLQELPTAQQFIANRGMSAFGDSHSHSDLLVWHDQIALLLVILLLFPFAANCRGQQQQNHKQQGLHTRLTIRHRPRVMAAITSYYTLSHTQAAPQGTPSVHSLIGSEKAPCVIAEQ